MMKTGGNIAGLNFQMKDGNHLEAQYRAIKIVQVNVNFEIEYSRKSLVKMLDKHVESWKMKFLQLAIFVNPA